MQQQLGLNTIYPWRLLQGFDDMGHQPLFDGLRILQAASVSNEKISDHTLTALIDEEGIARDPAPLQGGISGQNFGVDVAQDHGCRAAVVPGEQVRPDLDFVLQKGAQVGGREVPQVENFHSKLPRRSLATREWQWGRGNWSVVLCSLQGKQVGHGE